MFQLGKTALVVTGVVVLAAVGVTVMYPLVEECGNKLYKAAIKGEMVDIDGLGPEIVRKDA